MMNVELLVNPFCMADRDVGTIGKICEKHDVKLDVYNLWDIDDSGLDEIPEYMAQLIKEWRTGKRPGSVYSSAFVEGERISLNQWPEHLRTVEERIASCSKEET